MQKIEVLLRKQMQPVPTVAFLKVLADLLITDKSPNVAVVGM